MSSTGHKDTCTCAACMRSQGYADYDDGYRDGYRFGRKIERAKVLDEIDATILAYQDKGLLGALLVKVQIMRGEVVE